MLDRVQIKALAQNALKRNYWIVVLVAVIVCMLGGTLAGGMTAGDGTDITTTLMDSDEELLAEDPIVEEEITDETVTMEQLWAELQTELQEIWNTTITDLSALWEVDVQTAAYMFIGILVGVTALALLTTFLLNALFCNVITVGGHGWMLRHWRGETLGVGDAFAPFRIYKATVGAMLLRDIFVFLWSLLLVIPGVVKRLAYSMVPYIIYENPRLSPTEAIRISRTMTDGHKWELFVLELSFIGWHLLSAFSAGLVGIFWSVPYMGLTHAGVYETLKQNAIHEGKLCWGDFGPTPAADPHTPWDAAQPQASDGWNTPAEPRW